MPALTSCPVGVARLPSTSAVEPGEPGIESGACAKAEDAISVITPVTNSVFMFGFSPAGVRDGSNSRSSSKCFQGRQSGDRKRPTCYNAPPTRRTAWLFDPPGPRGALSFRSQEPLPRSSESRNLSEALTLNTPTAGVIGEPGMEYNAGSDEFGVIRFTSPPSKEYKIGDFLEVIVPLCDPVVNEFDQMYGIRKDKVEVVWPITGRGKSQ